MSGSSANYFTKKKFDDDKTPLNINTSGTFDQEYKSDKKTAIDYLWMIINKIPVGILLLLVIILGAANRIVYKIQLVPMGNYPTFISWFITVSYCLLYWSILLIRRYQGYITNEMINYPKIWKFVLMGLMDALGYVLGIFGARAISGYLLTLLPQIIIPTTMLISMFPWVGARYNLLQVFGALLLISGEIISLVPDFKSGTHATIYWAIVYMVSVVPNAISFVLKESVFHDMPKMDIFIVNSMDSIFQLIFTLALFPIVMIPGFGGIPFDQLFVFIQQSSYCFAGQNIVYPYQDTCLGEPYLTLLYVVINLTWNICLLLLLKQGGAVLTFIAAAVSLPIAHLAFAINWPLLGSSSIALTDIFALLAVLAGLIVYRSAQVLRDWRNKREEKEGLPPRNICFSFI